MIILSRGQTLVAACLLLACCLLAACLLLACCLLAAASCLLLACLLARCLPAACCLLAACLLACCLLAACLLLACCLLAACLLLACCLLLLLACLLARCLLARCLLARCLPATCLPAAAAAVAACLCCCLLLLLAAACCCCCLLLLAASCRCPRPWCSSYHPRLPIGFATANPFALQEVWGCTNRGLIWSRDAGHEYSIFKSNRIRCREFVCTNLCPSKSSLCAMLRLLLTKSLIIDEAGCAMVILLPWCDFPLPDVTFCIAAMPWGWCDFSRLMWLKHGARMGVPPFLENSKSVSQRSHAHSNGPFRANGLPCVSGVSQIECLLYRAQTHTYIIIYTYQHTTHHNTPHSTIQNVRIWKLQNTMHSMHIGIHSMNTIQ